MNEIRRPNGETEEIARIRETVARHPFPDFVTGFHVRLGEFDGDPAMWIVFKLSGDDGLGVPELRRRAEILAKLHNAIQSELFAEGQDRYPFFRSEYATAAQLD